MTPPTAMRGPSRYPLDADFHPVSNYLQATDPARPRFRTAADWRAGDEPVLLVVGAGYTGLAAAVRLGELRADSRRNLRIALVEQNRVASGPSGKSGGHVCGLQASDDAVRAHCGAERAARLRQAAAEASRLVRRLIARYEIPCDLRDGYLTIAPDGRQTVTEGGLEFGIDPFPFALGLAFAAERLGVEIYEGTTVTHLGPAGRVATVAGMPTPFAGVLASGGHRMAETIAALAPLRRRTTELLVGTILTDPLPDPLLREIMPQAAGKRLPFATQATDVSYGSIDRAGRMVFGAHATALCDPDPARIAATLARLFPRLWPGYREMTGCELGWQPLVRRETLCFTRDLLPNVGTLNRNDTMLYVHALGGHGIALGTLLGTAAAEQLWHAVVGPASDEHGIFDLFAGVSHAWLPPWQPLRAITASAGLLLFG